MAMLRTREGSQNRGLAWPLMPDRESRPRRAIFTVGVIVDSRLVRSLDFGPVGDD